MSEMLFGFSAVNLLLLARAPLFFSFIDSMKVFQFPQSGHLPIHFASWRPHS
jgi:hypothetical protein